MLEKKDLMAIHRQDIETMLENLGLLKDFKANNYHCQFCNSIMTSNNFGAIFSKNKKMFFSCSQINCLVKVPK